MHTFALGVMESIEIVGIVNMILPYIIHSCTSAMKGSMKERQSVLLHPFCHISHFAFPGNSYKILTGNSAMPHCYSQSVHNDNALLPVSGNTV